MTITIGGRIDETLAVQPVRVAVLTVSDTRDEESDTSGHLLAGRVTSAGHELADKQRVPDDVDAIRARISTFTAAISPASQSASRSCGFTESSSNPVISPSRCIPEHLDKAPPRRLCRSS